MAKADADGDLISGNCLTEFASRFLPPHRPSKVPGAGKCRDGKQLLRRAHSRGSEDLALRLVSEPVGQASVDLPALPLLQLIWPSKQMLMVTLTWQLRCRARSLLAHFHTGRQCWAEHRVIPSDDNEEAAS
jgi:hypothetical protein